MQKLTRIAVLFSCLTLVIACGGKKKGDAKKSGDAKITLEKKNVDKMGAEILLPKGAKTLAEGKLSTTYSLVLSDGANEINVQLLGSASKDLKSLVRMATMIGGKKILQKKAVEGGFLVVKKDTGPLSQVWVSRKGKGGGITAKVSVPDKHKDLAVKIALSLKVK